jgi:hypothetical protein
MPWHLMLTVLLLHFGPLTGLAPGGGVEATSLAPVGPAPAIDSTVDSVATDAFDTQRASFAVDFGGAASAYRVMAMFVIPNQSVPVAVQGAAQPGPVSAYELTASRGPSVALGDGRWSWTAPATPGLYPLEIRQRATGQTMTLNVFVMVPYSAMRHGSIQGYQIGNYPRLRRGYEAKYARPEGFVQVTPALEDVQVSPHFTLGQFVCKQAGGYPKYLVLRQPLLVKLEELLADVNDRGIRASTFAIMSAYRTPVYNRAIGNVTTFSRHQYGDAADIFIDEDHDGRMDDLNHDGRLTLADARVLGDIVNANVGQPEFAGLTGGMGMYAPTEAHGAFVHVDVRGFDARWGARGLPKRVLRA